MSAEKRCWGCLATKPVEAFGKNRSKADGRACRCRQCVAAYYAANRTRLRTRAEKWRRDHPAALTASYRKHKYGITQSQYDAMVLAQNARCAICVRTFDRSPHVDHDHETGLVRGLLCGDCNRCIGHARDSVATLNSATLYVQSHQIAAAVRYDR